MLGLLWLIPALPFAGFLILALAGYRLSRRWAAILGVDEVTPEQVALCMVAVKISREVHRPKRDNLVDIAGYAATLGMVREAQSKRTARLPPPYIVERCPSCDEELSRTGGPREVQDAED